MALFGIFGLGVAGAFWALGSRKPVATFGVIADAGRRVPSTDRVRESMLFDQVQNLVLPGDNLYDEEHSYPAVWDAWAAAGFRFDIVALGNHHNGGYEPEMNFFAMPAEFYSRVSNGARFISLNSDNMKNVAQQADFLERSLSQATERAVFVVIHHPPYTVSTRHGWEERREFQLAVRPRIQKYKRKITAVLAGHDHIASLIMLDDLPMLVSGAAFEQFNVAPVSYKGDDGTQVSTRWLYRGGAHWLRLDVDSVSGETWANFVNADAKVETDPKAQLERVGCSIRLLAGKAPELRENCAHNNTTALAVNPLDLPIEPEDDRD
jgi:hypothetical protein